jgi:hypothetical protein
MEGTEMDRLEKRVQRQEDLFSARDRDVTQLITEFKALAKAIEHMPAQMAMLCEEKIKLHKAQNCDQNHDKNEKPKDVNEWLVRALVMALGAIATLLGVKIGV